MSTTPNGRRLSPLFTSYLLPPVALATTFLSFLPSRALTPLVALLAGQTGPGAVVTSSLVASPGTVMAALTMAGEEMREVSDVDRQVLSEFGGRMWFYWAEGDDDGWVSQSSIREIEGVLDEAGWDKGRRFRCEEGMQHAFVLTSSEPAVGLLHQRGWG
jgi:hypothetical protein